jgi:hypothetical protein
MTEEMPKNLYGWKAYFRDCIEEARCAHSLTDDDRDRLIAYLRDKAELIFYSPCTDPEYVEESEPRKVPWWDR